MDREEHYASEKKSHGLRVVQNALTKSLMISPVYRIIFRSDSRYHDFTPTKPRVSCT